MLSPLLTIDLKAAAIAFAGAAATMTIMFCLLRLIFFSDKLPEKKKEEKKADDNDGYAHSELNDIMGYDFIRIVNIKREGAEEEQKPAYRSFADSFSAETRAVDGSSTPLKTTGAERVGGLDESGATETPSLQKETQETHDEPQEQEELSQGEIDALNFPDPPDNWIDETEPNVRESFEEQMDEYRSEQGPEPGDIEPDEPNTDNGPEYVEIQCRGEESRREQLEDAHDETDKDLLKEASKKLFGHDTETENNTKDNENN